MVQEKRKPGSPSKRPFFTDRNQTKIACPLQNAFRDHAMGVPSWVVGSRVCGSSKAVQGGPPNCGHSPPAQPQGWTVPGPSPTPRIIRVPSAY